MITSRILRNIRVPFIALVTFSSAATRLVVVAEESESAGNTDRRIELSYPDQYPETPEIFQTIWKQKLVAQQRIRKADLLNAYNATDGRFQHGANGATEVAGSHAPKALTGSSPGIMLWGPYASFPEGHYLVVYRFKLEEAPKPRGTIFLDVSHNACTRSGLRLNAAEQPAGEWQEVAVPLYLTEAAKLEFRFWPGGIASAIDRIYIFKVAPDVDEQKETASEELPSGEPVLGRSDVVRSPHTEDSGKIDISGLPPGARVRCPYTGKYFRVP